jgi:hypothetical protein
LQSIIRPLQERFTLLLHAGTGAPNQSILMSLANLS